MFSELQAFLFFFLGRPRFPLETFNRPYFTSHLFTSFARRVAAFAFVNASALMNPLAFALLVCTSTKKIFKNEELT